MMYLSKLLMQKAGDPYQWHRRLWTLYPDQPDANRSFLFCVERVARGGAQILLQSQLEPSPQRAGITVMATKPFQPRLSVGQYLGFRLAANPVKTIRDESGREDSHGRIKSCRVPLIQEDQQVEWLQRKLDGAATLRETIVNGRRSLHFKKGGRAGKVVQVVFEGVLQVESPDVLIDLVHNGIGPAKAFGCGLLLLRRA